MRIDKAPLVCIVEDDFAVRDSLAVVLESYGMIVRQYESAKELLADTTELGGACLLVDAFMPEMGGLALLEELQNRHVKFRAIVLTADPDTDLWPQLERAGALTMLTKPVDIEVLRTTIERTLFPDGLNVSNDSELPAIVGPIEPSSSALNVLIAEDQLLMADHLEEALVAKGFAVCGIARTADEAVELYNLHKPDLAVLDIRLAGGKLGTETGRWIKNTGNTGVLYATGDGDRNDRLTQDDGEASIAKPYNPDDIALALTIIQNVKTTGTAMPPFPPGFRLLPKSSQVRSS